MSNPTTSKLVLRLRARTSSAIAPPTAAADPPVLTTAGCPCGTALPFPIVKTPASKKRKGDFNIFVDNTCVATPTTPATPHTRPPLGVRTANSTPSPLSRHPDTPFAFSSSDPYWENLENYTPWHLTPPPTPTPSALPPPAPSTSPPLAGRRRARRPKAAGSAAALPVPVNMAAYQMLDMESWEVGAETIKAAYRLACLMAHPDKTATPEEKALATTRLQRITAAKDLLVNCRSRRQYHRDGKVPWVV